MDSHRFDALVQCFSTSASRREGLRLLLSGLIAGAIGLALPHGAAACRRTGELCEKNGQCCSGDCARIRKRKFKKKNGKIVEKRVGRCNCSKITQRCRITEDCCAPGNVCASTDCGDGTRCCRVLGQLCDNDCHCCFGNVCEDGRCSEPCKETREDCDEADDCCFENETCGSIRAECDPVDETVCCGTTGAVCEDACDCCLGFTCDLALGECVSSACLDSGQPCGGPGGPGACCAEGDICAISAFCTQAAVQAEVVLPVCCHSSGPCSDNCECCGPVECVDGFCGGPV